MKQVKKAGSVIRKYSSEKNRIKGCYLNSIGNEFLHIDGLVEVPRIPVKEVPVSIALEVLKQTAEYIPEFIAGHVMPEKRIPASEQHFIHLIKFLPGRTVDFVHFFKIDLKFSGDPDGITQKGDTEHYPAYKTDRLYYKSRIVPVKKNSKVFSPLRLIDRNRVESDQVFHTYAIFDEFDSSAVSRQLCEAAGNENFSISPNLYPFIVYDYFTAALNIPEPAGAGLSRSTEIYEPLFHFIYEKITGNRVPDSEPSETVFSHELVRKDGFLHMSEIYKDKMAVITASYKLFRNDEMAISGIRRLEPVSDNSANGY